MKFTKIEFFAAFVAAVATQLVTLVPNPKNAIAFVLLGLLTIRPLLTLNKNYKIISGMLLAYFLVIAALSYTEGKRHQERMADNPVQRAIVETKKDIERAKEQTRLPNQAL